MRTTIAVLMFVFVALPAAPARAALPAGHPPTAPAMRALGLRVTWPVAAKATLAPRSALTARIARVRGSDAPRRAVQVSLLRVDANGRAMRVVTRRSLRIGTFRGRLPTASAGHYQLRLDVAGRRFWSWLTVDPVADCRTNGVRPGSPAATMTAAPSFGTSGTAITLTITNVGTTCLDTGPDYTWLRRQPDGSLAIETRGTNLSPPPGAARFLIAPGASQTIPAIAWPPVGGETYLFKALNAGRGRTVGVAALFVIMGGLV
jgi:hypothetical protein